VRPVHKPPKTFPDYNGMYGMKLLRVGFDAVTRYDPEKFKEGKWLQRMCFLETVAG
jgi:Alternative oxidase